MNGNLSDLMPSSCTTWTTVYSYPEESISNVPMLTLDLSHLPKSITVPGAWTIPIRLACTLRARVVILNRRVGRSHAKKRV